MRQQGIGTLRPVNAHDIAAGHALLTAAGGVLVAEDGVPVTYEEWPHMPHAFAILADVVPEARRVFLHIARFLSAAQILAPCDPVAAGQDPTMYDPAA